MCHILGLFVAGHNKNRKRIKIGNGIRQTAKAPVDLQILGGFAIYVVGGFEGTVLLLILEKS
jgi:hypothetical protein